MDAELASTTVDAMALDFGDDMEFLQAADKLMREQEEALKRENEQKEKAKAKEKANLPSWQELNENLWFGSSAGPTSSQEVAQGWS